MKMLYICTHNRCRSILSEAITNQLAQAAGASLIAKSAGSQPAGEVHPLTLKYLAERGFTTAGLQSESWDNFESFAPDIVVTVCDSAAAEPCPLWFAQGLQLHWGLPDPSKIQGDEATQAAAFQAVMDTIARRAQALIALLQQAPERLDAAALAAIGDIA
jgi:arsenate reductase (thioredoxin)